MFYFVTAKISRDFHCVCYCYVSSTLNLLFLCLEVCLKKSVLEQKVKTTQTQQQHKHTLLKTGKGISRQTFSSKPPNRETASLT